MSKSNIDNLIPPLIRQKIFRVTQHFSRPILIFLSKTKMEKGYTREFRVSFLEAALSPGGEVLTLAVVLPAVPGVEPVAGVDLLGAGGVVGDVGVDEPGAGDVAVVAGADAGVAPVVVVDLK